MEKEIQNINLRKSTNKNALPPKILKISCNTSPKTLHNLFNECLMTDLPNLKLAGITPVFKSNKTGLYKVSFFSWVVVGGEASV